MPVRSRRPSSPCASYPTASVGRDVPGVATSRPLVDEMTGFETLGNVIYEFFKPFAVTLDFEV